ncbi:MAG: alkaline phosphatase family protein, partial [Bdellovibrionales bacterium]|nr:alkaline phosphatase family protein [Bdellovibrionales bacterium]
MSKQLFVVNVVGLTQDLIGDHSPFFKSLLQNGSACNIKSVVPAVTCSAQYTYLTGEWPGDHGAVGNGWYFKDLDEVLFWRQSNNLIAGEKVWDALRKKMPGAKTAQMFWWYNMYSSADYSVTPRPMYPADGRKIPDCYAQPLSLRDELTEKLGQFPLFQFWGPMTSIKSSQWIVDSAVYVNEQHQPELNLVYLPHLDYNLQRLGPKHPDIKKDVAEIDKVVEGLWSSVKGEGVDLLVLSEYGITEVDRPIHLNRLFRKQGWLQLKMELGREYLDAGASDVFA